MEVNLYAICKDSNRNHAETITPTDFDGFKQEYDRFIASIELDRWYLDYEMWSDDESESDLREKIIAHLEE